MPAIAPLPIGDLPAALQTELAEHFDRDEIGELQMFSAIMLAGGAWLSSNALGPRTSSQPS